MADTPGLHRCNVCFKTYKRREHLQRHRGTHTSERPHRCLLCSASFQRSDVLKRHLQTCDGASTTNSPSRRRSCDRCVRQKKACNSTQPCDNCAKRAVECQYSNPSLALPAVGAPAAVTHETSDETPQANAVQPVPVEDPASTFSSAPEHSSFYHLDDLVHHAVSHFPFIPDEWLGVDFSQPTIPPDIEALHHFESNTGSCATPSRGYSRGYSFKFLDDFTCRTGLVSSFECATLSQRQQIVSAFHQSNLDDRPVDFLGTSSPLSTSPNDALGDVPTDNDLSSWSSWLHNPIVIKLQQVVLLIKDVVTVKPNNSTVTLTWSPALEQQCLEFFSPSRFAKFIELYWSVWHPNVNFLHRPSFDPTNAKCGLLAGMALVGKLLSTILTWLRSASDSIRGMRISRSRRQRRRQSVVQLR